jgi:hypothetical protein
MLGLCPARRAGGNARASANNKSLIEQRLITEIPEFAMAE